LVLLSFPTRRSSDLGADFDGDGVIVTDDKIMMSGVHRDLPIVIDIDDKITALEAEYTKENIVKYTLMSLTSDVGEISNCATGYRSEEHTSELQSREN